MEDGTMTYPEYEAHVRSRRDYTRIARKDGSGERQVTGHGHCRPRVGGGGMRVRESSAWARGCEKAPGLPGSQVAFVQKRFHKDIFPNPVLMLNFCPAAEGVPGDLQSVTREILFLVDRSGTVSGPDLDKVKVRHGHGARDAPWVASPQPALPGPCCPPRRLCWWP